MEEMYNPIPASSHQCTLLEIEENIHPWGRQLADNGSGPALSATPGDQGRGTAPYIQLELYILLYSASNIQLCIYSASTTYPPVSCIWLQLDTSNKNQFKYSLPCIQLHILTPRIRDSYYSSYCSVTEKPGLTNYPTANTLSNG